MSTKFLPSSLTPSAWHSNLHDDGKGNVLVYDEEQEDNKAEERDDEDRDDEM